MYNSLELEVSLSNRGAGGQKRVCVVCKEEFADSTFSDHFLQNHVNTCENCGMCFASSKEFTLHQPYCHGWRRICDNGEFMCRCSVCDDISLSPEQYYHHLIFIHPEKLQLKTLHEQISPMFFWTILSFSKASEIRASFTERAKENKMEPASKRIKINEPADAGEWSLPQNDCSYGILSEYSLCVSECEMKLPDITTCPVKSVKEKQRSKCYIIPCNSDASDDQPRAVPLHFGTQDAAGASSSLMTGGQKADDFKDAVDNALSYDSNFIQPSAKPQKEIVTDETVDDDIQFLGVFQRDNIFIRPVERGKACLQSNQCSTTITAERPYELHHKVCALRKRIGSVPSAVPLHSIHHNLFVCNFPSCDQRFFESLHLAKVHNLRHSLCDHYCLDCTESFCGERNALVHHFSRHVGYVSKFVYRCPLCNERPPFSSLEALKKHMCDKSFQSHSVLSYACMGCMMPFRTFIAKALHDLQHMTSKKADCCVLCGTCEGNWSEANGLEHSMIHSICLLQMCRQCGRTFHGDIGKKDFLYHFQIAHMDLESRNCLPCAKPIETFERMMHIIKYHLVYAMRSSSPRGGMINERVHQIYLGLNPQ